MNKLFKGLTGITLGLALCFGFSFSASGKSANMVKAAAVGGEGSGSLTFSSDHKVSASGNTLNDTAGATFTFTTDSDYIALDGGSIHTGSGSKTCSYQSWSTDDYSGVLISSIVVNAKMASGSNVSVSAKINGNDVEEAKAITASAEDYTFTNSNEYIGGALEIKAYRSSATKKAIYIYSITVSYATPGGTSFTSYDVTVHYNDGVTADDTLHSSTSTGKISQPTVSDRDGYEFVGWYSDSSLETAFDFSAVVTGNCDIYAKWNKVTPKLATPAPTFDANNKQVTWENVDNASSYDLVVDNGSVIHNATSPYSVSSLEAGISHTVKVTAIGDGTNYLDSSEGSVSFAFLGHAGTEADPYTVADARLAIDSNFGKTDVYVSGIVSAIVTPYSSQYHNISYNISSDGLTTSDQLEVFRGKSYNGENFTSTDDIQVGDVVVVKGDLTKYNSTYEFAADNQLVSLVRAGGKELDSVVIDGEMTKTTYSTNQQWDPSGIIVYAVYTDNTSEDVTEHVTWSYNYANPAEMGVTENATELQVTAHYMGDYDTLFVMVNVEEANIVDTYHLSGKRYIYEQTSADADPVYMNIDNASSEKNPAQVNSKGQASVFLFTLVGDDTYTITNLDKTKGLYYPGSNNTLRWGANGKDYEWVINDDAVIKTVNNEPVELYGTYTFVGKDNNDNLNRYLCAYGSDWRTYNLPNHGNRSAKLQVEEAKDVAGFSVDTTNANKNVLKGTTFDAVAAEDAGFEPRINYTDSSYDPISCSAVTWTLETSIVTSEAVLYVSYLSYDVEITGMNIYAPTMISLSIDTTNVKTSYFIGDSLDISGAVITARDASDNSYPIEISQCTFSPANGDTLAAENTSVTVTYVNDDNSVATGSYAISVNAFSGYTKVTSVSDLEVGASYVIGVESSNPTYRLMGSIADAAAAKSFRNAVEASSVMSTDATRVSNTAPSLVGASTFTLLKNEDGQYAFYDMGNSKYLTGMTNKDDNHVSDSSSASDAVWWDISFNGGVTDINLRNTSRVLAYNYNNGSNPRFASYNAYTNNVSRVSLFKMDGSTLKTSVESFANYWLKMDDSSYDGDFETPNCSENYELLKIAYSELTVVQKNIFQYNDDFAAARARLNAWATANGETFTYGAEEPFSALKGRGIFGDNIFAEDDNNTTLILFIIATLGAGALSAFYLVRKRKRAQ